MNCPKDKTKLSHPRLEQISIPALVTEIVSNTGETHSNNNSLVILIILGIYKKNIGHVRIIDIVGGVFLFVCLYVFRPC